MASPRVLPASVVIPTRDRPELLADAIRSILAGDQVPAEVVVADQSVQPSVQLPTHPDVEVVHLRLSTVGLSRGRNAGIAAASHDVLVFVDDDVVVEPDWLGRLVGALEADPVRAAVTGAVLAAETDGYIPSCTYRTDPETFSGRQFTDPLSPNNMALRRQAFIEVGLFDEHLGAGAAFQSAEDNDFGYRLLESGYHIVFVPEAVVHHRGERSGRTLAALDWAYGRGQGAFYAKHMRWSDRYMLRRFGRNVAFRLKRMPPAVRGDRRAVREAIYLAGLFAGAIGWRWRRWRSGWSIDGPWLGSATDTSRGP